MTQIIAPLQAPRTPQIQQPPRQRLSSNGVLGNRTRYDSGMPAEDDELTY
jgi:hypothetical protein